ncbi:MAG: hypothetical protein ACLQOO_12090 [Terriglobia bacterium]
MTRALLLLPTLPIPISRLALLAVLAWTSLAFCNRFVAAAEQDIGQKVFYEAETRVGGDAYTTLYAGAGSIIVYDAKRNGVPILIGFAANGLVQGEYGVDGTGRPKNKGRVVYRQTDPSEAMPYVVMDEKDINIYTYHLKYLELTSVGNDAQCCRAYATKAVAFDNKVEELGKPNITYQLPQGGQLVIVNGKIKIGDNYISPNYDLTGKIAVPRARARSKH